MKAVFIITLYGLLFLPVLNAQECRLILSGYVRDKATEEPLQYATVSIQENGRGVLTDSTGYFELAELCAGLYHINVNHLGCNPARLFLRLSTDTSIIILLDHHTELLREIVVEGTRTDQAASQAQQIISESAIQNQSGQALADIAELVSGVRSLSNGSGISKPVIHGLFGNRIAVINNGLVQAGQQWGSDHAPEIDPNGAKSIKVVLGSDAIEYGANALGGAIIVDAGTIEKDPHLHGNLGYVFESNGRGHVLFGNLSRSESKWDWRLTSSFKKEGDHKAPAYFLTNTGVKEANASFQLAFTPHQRTHHQFYYSLFTTTIGIFAGSHISNLTDLEEAIGRELPFRVNNDFSYNISPPYQKVAHHLFKYSGKTITGNDAVLEWSYGLQSNVRKEYDIRRGNRSEIPALDLRLWAHSWNGRFSHSLNRLQYKLGWHARWHDNTNHFGTGVLPLIPDYTEGAMAGFLIGKMPVGNWTLEGGFRYDFELLEVWAISQSLPREIINRKHHHHDVAGSLGFEWKPNEWLESRLHTTFATRSPEVNELYSSGLHQGIAGIEEGDWNLKFERSFKAILSQTIAFHELVHIDIRPFSHWIGGYIYLKPEDELRLTIRGAFPVYKYVQEDAWLRGMDLRIVSDFSHHLEMVSSASWIRGTSLSDNRSLGMVPPLQLRTTLSLSIGNQEVWKGTKISLSGEYTGRQNHWDRDAELLHPPGDYFILDGSFETSRALSHDNLSIGIYFQNLLNRQYRNYLNRLRYFADEEGFSIRLTFRYEF